MSRTTRWPMWRAYTMPDTPSVKKFAIVRVKDAAGFQAPPSREGTLTIYYGIAEPGA